MVSLEKGSGAPQSPGNQGATFFNSPTDDDGRLVSSAQTSPSSHQHNFQPLKTIKHSALHLVASTAISIVGIVLALKDPDLDHRCKAYFIMLYLHAAYWFFTLVIDYILKKTHHHLRICGYLEFYQKTYTLHRLPIYIVSLWNAILLIIQTMVHHFYPEDFFEQCVKRTIVAPIFYITGLLWVETLILSIIHGTYITKVNGFNNSQHQPDVQRDHLVETTIRPNQSSQSPPSPSTVAPLNQTLAQTADLLSRQADLIRHLREHNEKLSNKLSTTTAELKTAQYQLQQASKPSS